MKAKDLLQKTLILVLGFSTCGIAQIPTPAHVVIAVEENHDYSKIVGNASAPYINSLIADGNAALFTQSFALTHPSQPNYLMLFSGSKQGVLNDKLPSGLPFTTPNLGGLLISAGKSFTGYSEDLPSEGFQGTTSGAYARKHNPWSNWQSAPVNGIPQGANLPLTAFPADFDSLPTVSFVVPNQNNDMHNGADPLKIAVADTWLRNHLDGYVQWAKTNNSLFILTFDEGTSTGNNRIVTLFVGEDVAHGTYSDSIDHHTVLRTLEDMYQLPYAGASGSAIPISSCWITALPVELSRFAARTDGRAATLQWTTETENDLYGFEIQRATDDQAGCSDGSASSLSTEVRRVWNKIGFVRESGSQAGPVNYAFADKDLQPGKLRYRLGLLRNDGSIRYSEEITLSIDAKPTSSALSQNYPNPFNPNTTIQFSLAGRAVVTLSVFNALGEEIATLLSQELGAGTHSTNWNATAIPSGIYFYRLQAGDFTQTRKLILLR